MSWCVFIAFYNTAARFSPCGTIKRIELNWTIIDSHKSSYVCDLYNKSHLVLKEYTAVWWKGGVWSLTSLDLGDSTSAKWLCEDTYEPSHLHSLPYTAWVSPWFHVWSYLMGATLVLHEDIRPGVRQPETYQASPHEHRWGHEDGDGLSDANEWTKSQVPHHCCQLTQSIAEPKACSSVERKNWRIWTDISSIFTCAYLNKYA